MSRSSLDRKARLKSTEQTGASTDSKHSTGTTSVTRLVARSRTRSRADHPASKADSPQPERLEETLEETQSVPHENAKTVDSTPVETVVSGGVDSDAENREPSRATSVPPLAAPATQYVHSTEVFTRVESHVEIYPDSPALCPIAVDRLARDLRAVDLDSLLRPARSVAEVFESPLPSLFGNDQTTAVRAQAIASPSDHFFSPSAQRSGNRLTDDLFRDTRSEADQARDDAHTRAPSSDTDTHVKTETNTEPNNKTALRSEDDQQRVRKPRIIEPAISHTPVIQTSKSNQNQPAVEPRTREQERPRIHPAGTRTAHRIDLPASTPGTERHLTVIEYGQAGVGPKAYLHAGLQANELDGVMVLNQLMRRLDHADLNGEISGHCVIVPFANPIGASQYVHGQAVGRYDLDSGEAFDRHYPQLIESVAELAIRHLRGDPSYDKLIVRGALRAAIAKIKPLRALDHLRYTLLSLACDADLVLDLRCEQEAVPHLYLGSRLWPQASDLHRQMQSRATLLAQKSVHHPFDDAIAGVWWDLADMLHNRQVVEASCLAATLELTGSASQSKQQTTRDADNLYRFLQRRGVVKGDPGPLPEPLCNPTPLDGVEVIRAERTGVVTFMREPGEFIRENDTVAVIDDPASTERDRGRSPVVATSSGILFSRSSERSSRPGEILCRIAGPTRLA